MKVSHYPLDFFQRMRYNEANEDEYTPRRTETNGKIIGYYHKRDAGRLHGGRL